MNFTMDVSGQFSVLLHPVRRGPRPQPGHPPRPPARALLGPLREGAVERPRSRLAEPAGLPPASPPRNVPHEKARSSPLALAARLVRRRSPPRRPQLRVGHLRAHDHRRRRRPVRGGHEDGLVQAGRDRGRDRAAARVDRLRQERGDQGSARFAAERGAARDRPAAGHQGQALLHRVRDQQLRHRGPRGQPHPEERPS